MKEFIQEHGAFIALAMSAFSLGFNLGYIGGRHEMKRTVFECRICGDACRLVSLGEEEGFQPCVCPYNEQFPCEWQKVSECEIPEDKEEESKEVKK